MAEKRAEGKVRKRGMTVWTFFFVQVREMAM
jgi:hypothetical protein